jgi:hypothetical protein
MKPVTVILLMGVAAIGGGLVVRYGIRPATIPAEIPARPSAAPPAVVAPPVGPSSPIPVAQPVAPVVPTAPEPPVPAKPSALRQPVHVRQASPVVQPRMKPAKPPAVVALQTAAALPSPVPTPQPEPNRVTLPAGMSITVRMNEALSPDRNAQGDVFSGTLEKPVTADGFVIAERGARVRGEVVDAKREIPELTIRLKEISTSDGQRVQIVSEAWRKQGPAALQPETSITFRLERPVEITERR